MSRRKSKNNNFYSKLFSCKNKSSPTLDQMIENLIRYNVSQLKNDLHLNLDEDLEPTNLNDKKDNTKNAD